MAGFLTGRGCDLLSLLFAREHLPVQTNGEPWRRDLTIVAVTLYFSACLPV